MSRSWNNVPLLCTIALVASTVCGAVYLSVEGASDGVGVVEAEAPLNALATPSGRASARATADTSRDARFTDRRTLLRPAAPGAQAPQPSHGSVAVPADGVRLRGESVVAALPQPLLDVARATSWNEDNSAALERFLVASFDADGDGALDDFERIEAVLALREAMWPGASAGVTDVESDAEGDLASSAGSATLSEAERRLHHDADESRRRDRQEKRGSSAVGAQPSAELSNDLRASIVERLQLEDDGRLTVAELARYMRLRNAGSSEADLNGDGHADDADLRILLDVASPIDEA